jgi:hypothetical protein
LAQFEAPGEYSSNDAILATRYNLLLEVSNLTRTAANLIDMAINCFDDVLNETLGPDIAQSVISPNMTNSTESTSFTDALLEFNTESGNDFLVRFRQSMIHCHQNTTQMITQLIQEVSNSTTLTTAVGSGLTFNWIRCWDTTSHGDMRVWKPTQAQLEAVQNQTEFYSATWHEEQKQLYEHYLETLSGGSNMTDDVRDDALQLSIQEASGRKSCIVNRPGTSWFFFTVMTTVGYGNQAPVSKQGRALVCWFGFFSILVFAAILSNCGRILAVVYDDIVQRMNLRILSRPIFSCLFWGIITFAWMAVLAEMAVIFWQDRLPVDDVPSELESQWFAYISLTTVGEYSICESALFTLCIWL